MRCLLFPSSLRFCALLLVAAAAPIAAQSSAAANLDGIQHPMADTVLDHLVGSWDVERTRGGTITHVRADVSWVLDHQFLQIRYFDEPGAKQPYEAVVYLGYDNASDRYVVHWLDVLGGRMSETLGYGSRADRGAHLRFEYPDGPFTNDLTYDPASRSWSFELRQRDDSGAWRFFATERWTRRPLG